MVVEVVNVELALGACGGKDVRSVGVELEGLNGTGVLVDLLNQRIPVGCQRCADLESASLSHFAPVRSFSASQSTNAPLSRAPAIIPLGYCSLGWLQAMSLNLRKYQSPVGSCTQSMRMYLDSTSTVATGSSSTPCSVSSNLSSQSSNCVSPEKSASTAPDFVPVAINGWVGPGDQANVAVRGISRRRTMVGCGRTEAVEWSAGNGKQNQWETETLWHAMQRGTRGGNVSNCVASEVVSKAAAYLTSSIHHLSLPSSGGLVARASRPLSRST